jgi:hypothetical protein
MLRTILVAAFFAAASLAPRFEVSAETWVISSDGSGDAPTIHAAIDSAAAGDSIYVTPANYTINSTITLDKSLVLVTPHYPLGARLTSDVHSAPLILIAADDCVVEGFNLEAGSSEDSAIRVEVASNATITYNWITGFAGNAVHVQGSVSQALDPTTIDRNVIYFNNTFHTTRGISITETGGYVLRNTLVGNRTGIYLDNAWPFVFANIVVMSEVDGVICINPHAAILPTFDSNCVWGNHPNYGGVCPDETGLDCNISVNPLFCGESHADSYYLQSASPCTAANNACGVFIGALPVGCGATAAELSTWGTIKAQYRE